MLYSDKRGERKIWFCFSTRREVQFLYWVVSGYVYWLKKTWFCFKCKKGNSIFVLGCAGYVYW